MSAAEASARAQALAADAAARRLARTEFVRPVVLEAGAGTGKTTALVARILAWTLRPGWDRYAGGGARTPLAVAQDVLAGVVAITFTERAAVEMEERVARDLGKLLAGEELAGLPQAELGIDAASARLRAAALVAALDHLRVSTIHGFCAQLLAEHALEAGLPLAQVVDGDGEHARAAARGAVSQALESRWGAGGDADATALAALGKGPRVLAEALEILIAEGVRAEQLAGDPYPEASVTARGTRLCAELAEFARDFGPALAGGRMQAARAALAACAEVADRLAGARGDEFLARGALSEFDGKARERLAAWSTGEFTQTERAALGPERADECARRARLIDAGLGTFAGADPALLRPARRVLGALLADARARLARQGVLSFHELLEHARELLERDPAVRAAARASIDQLLVDEFQDTDGTQCAIVAALALDGERGAPGARAPGLFLVGDPKQSLYAWRGADLAAYQEFVARCLERGGTRGVLCANFRSPQPLLDEVERLVGRALVHVEGLQAPFQPLIAARESQPGPAGLPAAVEHWSSWAAGEKITVELARQREGRALAAELAAERERGTPWKEMALLLRSTTAQEPYVAALRERGIPVLVERDKSFYRTREVIDALSLVSAVLDPADFLSLAAALRSSPVEVPDAALLPLWAAGFPAAAARLGRGSDGERAIALAAAEQAIGRAGERAAPVPELPAWTLAAAELARGLDELRATFAELSLDRWVQLLRARFPFEELEAARTLGAFRLANLERFFELLERGLAEHPGGIAGLLRALREGAEGRREGAAAAPGDAELDAVRVLSIHKSKGLEFELVVLADVHHGESSRASREAARVCASAAGPALELLGVPDLRWHGASTRAAEVATHESARLLYVAATRAKRRLIVAGAHGAGAGKSVLHRLVLERLGGAFGDAAHQAPGADGPDHSGVVFRALAPAPAPLGGAERFAAALEALDSAPEPAVERAPEPAARAAAASADLARLERARAAARARSARRLVAPVSALAIEESPPAASRVQPGDARGEAAAARARAVGSAVHAILARLDPGLVLETELESLVRRAAPDLEREVGRELGPGEGARAAGELVELAASAPFRGALERLAPCLARALARELPLVLVASGAERAGSAGGPVVDDAPLPDAPVAAWTGALDLLYRDADGRLVVADYKTDRGGESDSRALAERHRAQLEHYARAVEIALGERPRAEVWFLRSGARVTLD